MDSETNTKPLAVVEVAMEIAFPPEFLERLHAHYGLRPTRDAALSTSVGGIGPLLRDRIIAQAAKGLQVIGVTLLYETTWIQSWFEWGQLHLEKREVASYLREMLTDSGITLSLNLYDGSTLNVRVWKLDYRKAVVYFLDGPPVSRVVYPSEEDAPPGTPRPMQWAEELRYQQNWLIGRGTLALLKALNQKPDILVQSETPTLFAQHRLAQDSFQNDPFFEKTKYIFNDHTPMEYAHPIWSREILTKLKVDTSNYIPSPGTTKGSGVVDMTRLIVGRADGVFGVSQKHAKTMRSMASLMDYAEKIHAITNGVWVEGWQAPEFKSAVSLGDAELLKTKAQKKEQLLDWVWRHYGMWHTWKEQVRGQAVVLWARRITGYKRLDLLWSICKDPLLKRRFFESEIVLLIGGRIHQHDDQAQTLIYNLLDLISQDHILQERIVMLDNFNVWMAPHLFQGADAAIMLADDGREASATGFMKAQLNGDLIIAAEDGAIAESAIFAGKEKPGQTPNGFEVHYVHGHPTVEDLLRAFESLHQVLQNSTQHAAIVRSALAAESQVSIDRTVQETLQFYQQILAGSSAVLAS
jgi:starch phosphorylase